jgi:choline-glycine betaine transporter
VAWGDLRAGGLFAGIGLRRDLPLTIRPSALFVSGCPARLAAWSIMAVVATVLGVAVTMGLGVEHLLPGL